MLKDKQSFFEQVEEREVVGEIFQVTHRILRIPKEVYFDVLEGHKAPFSEIGAQVFVEEYMSYCGDTNGVLGMVRISEQEDIVELDAAIRYRINSLDRASCDIR